MRKSKRTRALWWPRGKKGIVRFVTLCSLITSLAGCATKPPPSTVSCPERLPIPARLSESRSESARAFSLEAQSFLSEVRESIKRW